MIKRNPVMTAIDSGRVAYGTWAQLNCPEFCEIAATSGLDFVIIDMEHGSFGLDAAVNMIRAVEAGGAAAFVRLPDHSTTGILKVLDAGAMGVVLPSVETKAQAEQIVKAARYAPRGKRGACPCVRGSGHGLHDWSEYTKWAQDNIMVSIIVETSEGIRNFEEIISVDGIDVISIGQFDLSQAMGFGGDHEHPDVRRTQEELAALARRNGIEVMAVLFDADPSYLSRETKNWKDLGARIMALSGDRFMLAAGYQKIVESAA